MKEQLKRQRSKVKEVGDGSPKLLPPRQPTISTPSSQEKDYLGVRKGRLEAEIQLQRGDHFDLLRDRMSRFGARRQTGDESVRTTATVVRTHRMTQLLVIGGTSLSQASMAR